MLNKTITSAAAILVSVVVSASASAATYDYRGKVFDCGSTGDAIQGLRFQIGLNESTGSYFLERYNYNSEFDSWMLGYQSAPVTFSELVNIHSGGSAALTFTSIALEPTVFGGLTVPATLVAFTGIEGNYIRGKIADTSSYVNEAGETVPATSVTDIVCVLDENPSWD